MFDVFDVFDVFDMFDVFDVLDVVGVRRRGVTRKSSGLMVSVSLMRSGAPSL